MQPSAPLWPGISVVIPTWNGLPLLATYLPSVRAALESYPGPWECLVVDDGGTDATARELPALFPQAHYLRRERNEGFPSAANAGFDAARHECVLLLNNDIRVERGFLLPLAERFRAAGADAEGLFAVVSLQINPDPDDPQNAAYEGRRVLRFNGGELQLPADLERTRGTAACPTALAHGGCSLFSRARVRTLGGFCRIFSPFYYEDVELSVQALRRGWRIVFEPRSVVWHRPNSTTRHHVVKTTPIMGRNAFLFQWLVLDGFREWAMHLLCIFPRLVSRSLRGRFDYPQGLWRAAWKIGAVRQQRRARARGATRTLGQVLGEFRGPTLRR